MPFIQRLKRVLTSTDSCDHDYRKWRTHDGVKYVCRDCWHTERHYATVEDQVAAEGVEAITP